MVKNPEVHRTHCCSRHGCKYGDGMCPVAHKQIQQAYPCEFCYDESQDPVRSALQDFVDSFEMDFVLDDKIVDDPDGRWGQLGRLYQRAKDALDD